MSYIETKSINLDVCKKKIEVLKNLIEVFISCSTTKYPFIKENRDIYNFINAVDYKDIIKLFNNSIGDMYDFFYQAYCIVSQYKRGEIIEELLIEFNNFLSHFVKHIIDPNLSSGISHLYRGCLDVYKDIIYENNLILLSYTDERDNFIDLRLQECDNIGKKEFEKTDILKRYREIAINLLTINDCNEM